MKLISFTYNNEPSYGVVQGNDVIDLGAQLKARYTDLRSFLGNGGLSDPRFDELIKQGTASYTLDEVTLLPVIPNPDKIFCVGINYDDHRKEAKLDAVENPVLFFRFAQSQIAHNEPMIIPKESDQLDFEGELAVVIGREGRRISESEANSYVAGYSCYNDGSIRDWQKHSSQWGPGKNFDGTGAFGPWLVTMDEFDDKGLAIETRLNGEVMQKSSTDQLVHSVPKLISYISKFTTLVPGDVIVTGTPSGVGAARNPKIFMKEGDVVEVEIEKIGVLKNPVKNEQ